MKPIVNNMPQLSFGGVAQGTAIGRTGFLATTVTFLIPQFIVVARLLTANTWFPRSTTSRAVTVMGKHRGVCYNLVAMGRGRCYPIHDE